MYTCFHPKRVFNKYTGEYLYTPCRKCDACARMRSYELAQRVEREMLKPSNKASYFLTLTYSNKALPVYSLGEDEAFHSNRDNMPVIDTKHCIGTKRPVKFESDTTCFAHLCVLDTKIFIGRVRTYFHRYLNLRRKRDASELEKIQRLFPNFTYEDFKFRYFIVGEYGPNTLRPHYHCIIWWRHSFSAEQERYLSKVVHSCWTFGNVDFQAVTSGGVNNYLANYVTSSAGLPEILRHKSIKPFANFSKFPTIGAFEVDDQEVRKYLFEGDVVRSRFNSETATFDDYTLPSAFFRRYFPKCQGFSYKTNSERVRIYSYVFNYFKDHPRQVDPETLTLADIPFPGKLLPDGTIEEWSYTDRYASLVCYRYCVIFGCTPEYILACFDRIYTKLASLKILANCKNLDEALNEDTPTYGDDSSYSRANYLINMDIDFLESLPECVHDLELFQIYALERYGIDINLLYIDEIIDLEYLNGLHYTEDPSYIRWVEDTKALNIKGLKTKKINDYTRLLPDDEYFLNSQL